MRRPNGMGTIVKLSGNRRKPYAVRIAARDKYGEFMQKTLDYYASPKEAQVALDQYNADKAAGVAPQADKLALTVTDIYELWSARKYDKAGTASIQSYKASWIRLEGLGKLKMRNVTIDHLQAIIDQGEREGLSKSSICNDKMLMKALFQFAMERDIIGKDYSAFVQLPHVDAKYEKGAFNDVQMKKLEDMAADGTPWADTVLMLCYTGFRISEFLELTAFSYNRNENYLCGGLKTDAGKNRIVPVHPKIRPYLNRWIEKNGDTIICGEDGALLSASRYRGLFKTVVEALGAPQATPHWCRHTFATRLHAAGVAELEQKRLMGHADKNVTEHYTHTDIAQLSAAISLLA